MIAYIDAFRHRFGVEPICEVLQFAPSTYWSAKRRPPSARSMRDTELKPQIARVHAENFGVYGADKIWAQLNRENIRVARCTIERLMRELGLQGAIRGKVKRTTIADDTAARPRDLVDRNFTATAPNRRGAGTTSKGALDLIDVDARLVGPEGQGSSVRPRSVSARVESLRR